MTVEDPTAEKPKKDPRLVVTVRLSPAGRDALDKIAAGLKISRSDAIREAFADYTEKHKEHLR